MAAQRGYSVAWNVSTSLCWHHSWSWPRNNGKIDRKLTIDKGRLTAKINLAVFCLLTV